LTGGTFPRRKSLRKNGVTAGLEPATFGFRLPLASQVAIASILFVADFSDDERTVDPP
jgi:hypothetical protein